MDQGLKQRIIGAVVLVIAAVIFLPMLLSGQDETVQVEVDVPEAPVLDERDITAAEPPQSPPPAPVADIPPPRSDAAMDTPAAAQEPDQAEPAAPIEEVAKPTPVTPPAEKPAAADGGWVIQLGSFSSADNAGKLRQTLVGQGYNAYTRTAQSSGNPITRVYVGPLASRETANQVRDELERRHQSKGLVVAHDANTRAR